MMKAIVTIILALTLAGCSVSKTVVRTSVHPETQHHIDENTVFFIQLVNTIRLNSNVKKPNAELKNQIPDRYGATPNRRGLLQRVATLLDWVLVSVHFAV